MIKYTVMNFDDVKDFQEFRIAKEPKTTFIKLPVFMCAIPFYTDNYVFDDKNRLHQDEIVCAELRNAYKVVKGYETLNEYVYISGNTEVVVDNIKEGEKDCMDEDAKQASIPYSYNAPRHDWKCGYPERR